MQCSYFPVPFSKLKIIYNGTFSTKDSISFQHSWEYFVSNLMKYAENQSIMFLKNFEKLLLGNAYMPGALDVKTKEMLGLVSSLVLRCDDCVKYHILKCAENGVTEEEFFEILGIGTLVGGTIVVPHMRRAVEFWDDLKH